MPRGLRKDDVVKTESCEYTIVGKLVCIKVLPTLM